MRRRVALSMTKYEELSDALRKVVFSARPTSSDSLDSFFVKVFFGRLLTGFVSYMGVPAHRVSYHQSEPKGSGLVHNALNAPTRLSDGWWVAYVRATLSQGQGLYPELEVLFRFRVLVEPDRIRIQVGESSEAHMVPVEHENQVFDAVYQEAFESALRKVFALRPSKKRAAVRKRNLPIKFPAFLRIS